ncbi:ABC transporter permease [Polaribacter sp.]|uniref:ABC transporter permease n=1 Tax=Polaribacter sp. TaxID=1920175 RepID=UPI003F699FED
MNIITIIASFGVIVSSLALFIILSGFSGLRTFSYSLLDASDPDIKITSTKGKSFILDKNIKQHIEDKSSILGYSKVIEERVFLEYADKNEIAYIKGVDDNYTTITKIDSAIYIGDWLDKNYRNTAIIGRATALKLSLGVNSYGKPLTIMVPKPGKGFINPTNAFYKMEVQILGIYSGTEEFESKYVFVTLNQAKNLLKFKDNQVSALELKIKDTNNIDAVAEKLQNLLGTAYTVKTKEQLNEVFYKVINTENFVSYLIFTLIIIIALFNVIGAIIMMIIDKKQNLKTLYSLGLTIEEIKKIFRYQGFLLTCFGMLVGLLLGIILVLLQDSYGLFMITQSLAYPVELQLYNVFIVIFTITVLGFFAAKIASSRINKKFIEK